MFTRFKQSKLFFWTVEIVLTIIGIYFISQMANIFKPLIGMASAILLPLIVAGFLYYMFDPIVVFLEERGGVPRVIGFLLSFIVVVFAGALILLNVVPKMIEQTTELTQNLPIYAEETGRWLNELSNKEEFKNLNLVEQLNSANLSINNLIRVGVINATTGLSLIVGFAMNFLVLLFTVPFILVFMFKDGHGFLDAVSKFFPLTIRKELRQTVRELNETLSAYISSTVLDAFIIGILSFLAMMIFKQPYGLLLAIFCGVTNIIPYVGPFIGAVPAVIVGLFISPLQALYMGLSILVIQQLDGNLIKPLLFGKSMNIHPLTIILLLIGAGSIAGILGMLICIPVYAVIKTLIINIHKIYQIQKKRNLQEYPREWK
ncbi:AI-2E family transporter [Aerococcus urinaeequi]|uniref:AI-2E family transporter n=1 Tax=Aerococcus urinaeequi TaxID=51665 RepID=UPI00243305BF|nr:AI-2E family transporter [Aerococcus urinaeequi]